MPKRRRRGRLSVKKVMASGDIQWSEIFEGHGMMDAQPFLPQSDTIYYPTGTEQAGDLSGYCLVFNQAYILNTVADGDKLSRTRSAISNMQAPYWVSHTDTVNFGVEVIRSKENLLIEKATFTGWSGQEWLITEEGEEEGEETPMYEVPTEYGEFPEIIFKDDQLGVWNPVVPENSGDQGYYTGYYPVCKMEGDTLVNFTLRDNIELSDRQFKQMGQYREGLAHNNYQISGYMAGSGWRNTVLDGGGNVTGLGVQMGTGEAQVLIKVGKEDETNPVRVRSVSAGTGIAITQEAETIVIDSTFAADSSWSGINTDRNWYEVYGEAPAFTHPDGTAADPAKFRTLEEGSGIRLSYQGLNGDGDYERIRFDVDLSGASGLWSGECCGDNEIDTYCVYREANASFAEGERSYGTAADPAIFRRLTGAGSVDIWYGDVNGDPVSQGCLIVISGASGCCSGVENAGGTGDGVGIYQEANGYEPAYLRRLIGAGLLADEKGHNNLIYTTPLNDDQIIFDARWSGQNLDGAGATANALRVYKQPDDGYDGKPANPAEFRTLLGINGITTQLHSTDNVIEISGSLAMNTGLFRNDTDGSCDYGQKVYVEGSLDPFVFRTLTGRYDTANASQWASQGGNQINVEEDGNMIRVKGNNKEGTLVVPRNIKAQYDHYLGIESLQLIAEGYLKLTWKDGLISGFSSDNSAFNTAQTGSQSVSVEDTA